MTTRVSRFDLDWWVVQKRFVYAAIFFGGLLLLAGAAGLYVWAYGNPFRGAPTADGSAAGARFVSLEGGVRVVRADTREVVGARSDTRLLPGDIVQTQEDGRARILLADGSNLFVKPNSVVTIAENTAAEGGKHTKVRVAVESGQINVHTEQQPEGASNVVRTQLTESRVAAETDASFHVREDKTEAIRVGGGAVETSTRGGDVTTLRGGEYASVNTQGAISAKEKLLSVPTPTGPRNLERVQARRGGASTVALRWQRPATGAPAHYRVEVATSPFFVPAGRLIERDQLQATEFTVDDLRQGNYFWRVLAVASSGQASDWSEPQKFVVVSEGGTGDAVGVDNVQVEYVAGQVYVVRGRTQPGNTVRCSGRETLALRDGTFQLQINAPRGAREIQLDAADTQGNRNTFRFPLPAGG
ncbi:MAG TPA: fibronectin type III domain-containing protein [Pyrinomonadaceae bacterium]|nr:fibronectin type III domain-containing protein [Pyrinomonadaceae bacterium]